MVSQPQTEDGTAVVALPDVYTYLDYRKYLAELFAALRRRNPATSYRGFGRMCGSTSPNFLQLVLGRTLHPGARHLRALRRALRLDDGRGRYLAGLVDFARARSAEERHRRLRLLLRRSSAQHPTTLRREQYEYFSAWYHSAVRALLGFCRLRKGSSAASEVAARLGISRRQAGAALALLERLGLVALDGSGTYVQARPTISTGDEVRSLQVMNFQRETMKLALRALDRCPTHRRDISTVTLNISQHGFAEIKQRVQSFRKEVMDIAAHDSDDDRVYQLNMQFFPLTMEGSGG